MKNRNDMIAVNKCHLNLDQFLYKESVRKKPLENVWQRGGELSSSMNFNFVQIFYISSSLTAFHMVTLRYFNMKS